ncbi:MAG: hypothetical protein ABIT76_08270 [Chthoniobacterales bacterium]
MSNLTDADKKSFIDKVIGTLKNPEIKARLIAKEWDPTLRTTSLENGVTSVRADEGIISGLESTLTTAIKVRRADLDNNYDMASSTISSIEGALGKDDPLVRDLRQFRGSLSNASAPATPPTGGG